MNKLCENCGEEIIKDSRFSWKQFYATKFCGQKCFGEKNRIFRLGKPSPAKGKKWKRSTPVTEEERTKKSLALKGRRLSKEHVEKIRLVRLGVKHTPEQIRKLKESLKLWVNSPRGKEHMKKLVGSSAGVPRPSRRGENSHFWKGGVTSINVKLRASLEYRNWRKAVYARDNYTCQICGAKTFKGLGKTIKLNADHIKPWALFPELRFDINNGRTLCVDCHKKTDTFGYKSSFRVKPLIQF